ncbi:MAG: hypothetical protein ACI8UD_000181 [Planctomycetota bacterium]|jgi:hypothetical protein
MPDTALTLLFLGYLVIFVIGLVAGQGVLS